jgi:hypothetical protein
MANIAVLNGVLEQILKYQCRQEDKQLAPLIFKRLSCPFLVRQKQLEELQIGRKRFCISKPCYQTNKISKFMIHI